MNNRAFDFELPRELIAQRPLKDKGEARLMVIDRQKGEIEHLRFKNIVNLFSDGDVLVLNNTKVIPARLYGKKETGGKIEVLLLHKKYDGVWEVLIRGKIRQNASILFSNGISSVVLGKSETGLWILKFDTTDDREIFNIGRVPIPPYIKRKDDEKDILDYQTVYAEKYGSIAAPTAGLHFTKNILKQLKDKGVIITFITLHIGYASLRIIKETDERRHLSPEFFEISEEASTVMNDAIRDGRKICAAGTSSVRAIESAVSEGRISAYRGFTDLFIEPGYQFRCTSRMITNFHLPGSTHLSMVCAFGGTELMRMAYLTAIETGYRFYSYGDAMIIV